MSKLSKARQQYHDFLLDRPRLREFFEYTNLVIVALITGFMIAYNFRAFITPTAQMISVNDEGSIVYNNYNLISGGASGVAQVVVLLLQKLGVGIWDINTLQSIIYLGINIPLFFLAFFKIGKKFAIFSFLSVAISSLFIAVIPDAWVNIFSIGNDLIARGIFGGVVNGIGIAIAVNFGISTGGTDIVSMYFGLKKGKNIGIYVLMINSSIIVAYSLLSAWNTPSSPGVDGSETMALYSIFYFYASSFVIDRFSSRNKKVKLEIVTKEERLAKLLVQHFPHGCTITKGKGAFSGGDVHVLNMVISSFELKEAKRIIYKVDPSAFITVTTIDNVIGKFYLDPIK